MWREDLKPIALIFVALLLLPAAGQDSAPSSSGEGHSQYCRGDESDSPDCITPPRQIYAPDPDYPVKERGTGHEGNVILRLVVDADGVAHDIAVSGSLSPAFDAAALEAVKKWKFTPATKNGKPIPAHLAVQVEFHATSRR
jgi:periplasmic protein TonB